jgi:hypothetical protein
MEEVLQALRASGLPDEEIPARYHRIAVLIAALITSEAGAGTVTPAEHEQGMELFRVAVLGADPERFPSLSHFAREVRPLGADRRAAFEELLAERPEQVAVVRNPEFAELNNWWSLLRALRELPDTGPVVVLNADRWRGATPEWTGDLAAYREMLVNHEVGHLLGLRHPARQCPVPGRPARVMAQQSTELRGCLPNPWPVPDEVARAARHDLPLAPPYSG